MDPQTNIAVEDKAENAVRSHLLNYWPIWRLAIEKSLEYKGEQERIPFFTCANFRKIQSDPKTSVALVLGAAEKTKN